MLFLCMALEPLEESVAELIKKERYSFSQIKGNADATERHFFTRIPWEHFPNTTGIVSGISIFKHDVHGEIEAYYGDIFIHSEDGTMCSRERIYNGVTKFSLSWFLSLY